MGSRSFRAVFGGVSLALLFGATQAHAEPSASDKETARGLMATGRADRASHDLAGALKAFTAADAIMHVPTTGLEVARAQVDLDLLVEARDTALRVSRIPAVDHEPAPFKMARDAAAALSDDLAARIPSLTVTLKASPDAPRPDVKIDGAPVAFETLGEARKLNPGHHVVVAASGPTERRAEVDLAERDKRTVTLDLTLPGQNAAVSGSAPAPDEGAPSGSRGGRSPLAKALLFGGFGLAGAGVITGSITGAVSLSKTSGIKSSGECEENVCNPSEDGDISTARTMATVSTVSFVVAGAGAVAGVVGLMLKPAGTEARTAERTGPSVEPALGLTGLTSVGLRGRF
jgi:hypothetical protein